MGAEVLITVSYTIRCAERYREAVKDPVIRYLKSSLRKSMAEHLSGQMEQFGRMLLSQAESIYPAIKQEMSLLISDRLDAISSNLSELNEAQKAEVVKALRHGGRCCEKAKKKVRAMAAVDDSVDVNDDVRDEVLPSLAG